MAPAIKSKYWQLRKGRPGGLNIQIVGPSHGLGHSITSREKVMWRSKGKKVGAAALS